MASNTSFVIHISLGYYYIAAYHRGRRFSQT